jgi:hypothetical protein
MRVKSVPLVFRGCWGTANFVPGAIKRGFSMLFSCDQARILDVVFLSNQSPLGGVVVLFPRQVAERHSPSQDSNFPAIRRMLRLLLQHLFNCLVLAEGDVEFCSQRNAPRAEEIKFLAHAFQQTIWRQRRAEGEELVTPKDPATWWSMGPLIDLE